MDDILDVLVAHGVPGATIVRVAQLITQAKQLQEIEAKQAEFKDYRASYMRDYRAVTARNSHVKLRKVTLNASSSLREEENRKEKKKGATGTKLPSDWKPRQQEIDEGLKLGWSLIGIEAKADDMRIWAEANSNRAIARKADWNATFRGMLRRDKPKPAKPERSAFLRAVI